MATSPFGYRAKDCCVITDAVVKKMATSPFGTEPKTVVPSLIQLLGKQHHRHFGTVSNIKHCHITNRVIIEKGQHLHLGTEPKM